MPTDEGRDPIQEMLGREALSPPQLIQELNRAGWPTKCLVHPLDFLNLTRYVPSGVDADTGPYFYIGCTRVTPETEGGDDLNLTAGPSRVWAP